MPLTRLKQWPKRKIILLIVGCADTGRLAAIQQASAGAESHGGTAVQQQSFKAGVFGIGTVDARLTYAIGPTQAGRGFQSIRRPG